MGRKGTLGRRGVERERAVGESLRIDAAECQVGVGHRSLAAAAPIRGRSRIGARAVRTHGNALHPVDARDRAAARADLDHLDHRHADGKTAAFHVPIGPRHLERARPLGLTLVDEADLRGRAAHVEGQHALERALARDPGGEQGTAGGPGLDEPHRKPGRDLERGETPARHHEQQRARHAERVQLGAQPQQIALHHRAHVRIGAGRREPLVLSDLRADLAREAEGDVGRQLRLQYFGGALLVLGPGVGVHEPDRDRPDPLGREPLADSAHGRLVQLAQDPSPAVAPPRHREPQRAGDERKRSLHVHVVLLEALLVAHLEDVAHPLGGDERGPGALPLDEGIRGQGRAVDEDRDFRRRQSGRGEHASDPLEHAVLRRRRRQYLGGVTAGGAFQDDVGEGPADVGRQSRAHQTDTLANRGSRQISVSST